MRNIALVVVLACAAVGLTAMSPPPVDALLLGQAKCGNDVCFGSKNVQVKFGGNITVSSPDGGFSVAAGGAVTAPSLTTTGTATTAVSKPALLDAGSGQINGSLQVLGNLNVGGTTNGAALDAGSAWFRGDVQFAGQPVFLAPLKCGADVACGTVALSSGTPSTATKTVTAGSSCVCWPIGNTAAIAAGGCAGSVSSTTATFTGPNTVTTTVAWMCFK